MSQIAGHVTGGAHREFAMASGEMTDAQFLAFNVRYGSRPSFPHLRDGAILAPSSIGAAGHLCNSAAAYSAA